MNKFFVVLLIIGGFISCKNTGGEEQEALGEVQVPEVDTEISDWKIIGTEPFWNISIKEDTILYTRLNEKIDSVYFTNHHFSNRDSIIEFHLADPDESEASLVLRRGTTPCSDGMSDTQYEYNATFIYKQETLKGCGEKIE